MFGSKFVELIYPSDPSPAALAAGAVLQIAERQPSRSTPCSRTWWTCVKQIDPSKLNSVLSALAEGLRRQGERIGQSITDTNEVLAALNPRTDTMREDFRAVNDVKRHLRRCGTEHRRHAGGREHHERHHQLAGQTTRRAAGRRDGLSRSGVDLAPARTTWSKPINLLEPTTNLLMKYNPELTCLLVGGQESATSREA